MQSRLARHTLAHYVLGMGKIWSSNRLIVMGAVVTVLFVIIMKLTSGIDSGIA